MTTTVYESPSTQHGDGCTGNCGCADSSQRAESCGSAACAWSGAQALAGLERTRFYPRQIVTPDDLTQDQIYFKDKLRRHNRLLHGWGLVCGLVVERCARPDDTGDDPCRVRVTSGDALDPFGNEIVVSASEVIDLCKEDMLGMLACFPHDDPWCRPVETSRTGMYFLAVRFRERAVKPVHAPTGCSCKEAGCENSRYRDEYEFSLLAELPDHYKSPCGIRRDWCEGIDECPPCPASGWIVLATVTMKGSEIDSITDGNRRHVLSLAGQCLDCSNVPPEVGKWDKLGARKHLIGIAAVTPDALVRVHAVIDGTATEVEIPVASADLRGKTAREVATAWANVPLFNTDEPSQPLLRADVLFAHSPIEGSWIVESADDLSRRLGTPMIDTEAYPERLKAIQGLLDAAGKKRLHEDLLDNIDRLDAITPEMLAGVSARSATTLRTLGIHSLADLATKNFDDPAITPAVLRRLQAVRDAITPRVDIARTESQRGKE